LKVRAVTVRNYRSLKLVEKVPIGDIAVFVGRNDAGKSNFLYALNIFFNGGTIKDDDLTRGSGTEERVEIEVLFSELPTEAEHKLRAMHFLTKNSKLVVRKSFTKGTKQPEVALYVYDFDAPEFRNLCSRKEQELNDIAQTHDLDFTQSGRSITNQSKIEALWDYATKHGLSRNEQYVSPDKESWKQVEDLFPNYRLFPSELNLKVERAEVQSPFQDLVEKAASENQEAWDQFRSKVEEKINADVEKIEEHLIAQTDSITKLIPKPDFGWKGFTLSFDTQDASGAIVPLENRGMGVRRLVMVSFLRYQAEKSEVGTEGNSLPTIYAIEEPETSLHPSAQRNLIDSFKTLKDAGNQIILNSHSPVFVAEASHEDVVLVTREAGTTAVSAGSSLNPDTIVAELGIEPRDQVGSFSACVFVEGVTDQVFFPHIAKKFKEAELIASDFEDLAIGFLPVGGNNLRFFVERMHIKKINRRFGIVIDSNKDSAEKPINQICLDWQGECIKAGGKFFILRKREIENYLAPAAIKRATGRTVSVSDFNNVKKTINEHFNVEHLKPILDEMSAKDFLEMDKYAGDDGRERHELLEIIIDLMTLTTPKG